ncbi:MAG: Fic family protein [Bacilli bacterium]
MLDRIFDLAKIQSKIASFSKPLKQQYNDYLIRGFGVLFTFHSNRIEGTNRTLTLNDTKEILNNTYDLENVIDKNKQREINETINHQNAFKYIFEVMNKDIDLITLIKNLHQIIGSGIIEGAGNYKEHENYLVNSNGEDVNFTIPTQVANRMEELKQKYEKEWQELTAFERAVRLHMAVINIHPFSDGNGRVARLIMNYELIKNNYPPANINESQKLSYYSVIEEINVNTDYQNKPLEISDIKLFNETIQQLSIVTFKNMQKYFEDK